jgi:NAD(P)-dependent dehydrogenase (short-subunit alcohol dehydrogenase family)
MDILAQMKLPAGALAGKTGVVTGSGRGIGREAARVFACLEARVVVAELSDEGKEAEAQIRQAGGQAAFIRTDVSDEASVAALAEQTRRLFGPADVLVNNAILCPVAGVLDMPPALWDRVIGVNLRGTFLTCRAFLPDLLKSKGVVINMVSTDAMPGLSAYIASKQGITGFTQSLAAEVGSHGVRVIAFAPGMVDTPGLRGAAESLAPRLGFTQEQFLSMPLHPAYPGLMPAEHAGAATVYLAAALADEYHGEVVNGYTVLERAGAIAPAAAYLPGQDGAPIEVEASPGPVPESGVPAGSPAGRARQARDLTHRLVEVIAATQAEFNRLPVFVRPMARGGFKSKAGQSLQDWTRTLENLAAQLEQVQGSGSVPDALQRRIKAFPDELVRLKSYYLGVPAETARFTRDQELLKEVARLTAERTALIDSLIEALGDFK